MQICEQELRIDEEGRDTGVDLCGLRLVIGVAGRAALTAELHPDRKIGFQQTPCRAKPDQPLKRRIIERGRVRPGHFKEPAKHLDAEFVGTLERLDLLISTQN